MASPQSNADAIVKRGMLRVRFSGPMINPLRSIFSLLPINPLPDEAVGHASNSMMDNDTAVPNVASANDPAITSIEATDTTVAANVPSPSRVEANNQGRTPDAPSFSPLTPPPRLEEAATSYHSLPAPPSLRRSGRNVRASLPDTGNTANAVAIPGVDTPPKPTRIILKMRKSTVAPTPSNAPGQPSSLAPLTGGPLSTSRRLATLASSSAGAGPVASRKPAFTPKPKVRRGTQPHKQKRMTQAERVQRQIDEASGLSVSRNAISPVVRRLNLTPANPPPQPTGHLLSLPKDVLQRISRHVLIYEEPVELVRKGPDRRIVESQQSHTITVGMGKITRPPPNKRLRNVRNLNTASSTNLFLVCSQIRDVGIPQFYGKNVFSFSSENNLEGFASSLGSRRKFVRSVQLASHFEVQFKDNEIRREALQLALDHGMYFTTTLRQLPNIETVHLSITYCPQWQQRTFPDYRNPSSEAMSMSWDFATWQAQDLLADFRKKELDSTTINAYHTLIFDGALIGTTRNLHGSATSLKQRQLDHMWEMRGVEEGLLAASKAKSSEQWPLLLGAPQATPVAPTKITFADVVRRNIPEDYEEKKAVTIRSTVHNYLNLRLSSEGCPRIHLL